MPEVTKNTRVRFGGPSMRGRKICELPTSALHWLADKLDSDLAPFAVAAQEVLDERGPIEQDAKTEADLEAAADDFLRNHGCGGLVPRRRRRMN